MDGIQDLGQRIVQTARLAVAMHLYESVARQTSPGSEAVRVARQMLQRQIATGGAGSSAAGEMSSSRLGDLVTDDERDGLFGLDATFDPTIDDESTDA